MKEVTEVVDVGLLDQVVRRRSWRVEEDDGEVCEKHQSQQSPIPEDTMSELEKYTGDGQAKVTVGGELAHSKDFGCKAQAFVSVSVTCGNNEEDITAVHGIIHSLVRNLVNEDLTVMKKDRDAHIGPVVQPKASLPPTPQARTAPVPSGARPAVARPSFKR